MVWPLIMAALSAASSGAAAAAAPAAAGAAGGAAAGAAGGGLMAGLGKVALGQMAGGPMQSAAGMIGTEGASFGGMAKNLLMDRISNQSMGGRMAMGMMGGMDEEEEDRLAPVITPLPMDERHQYPGFEHGGFFDVGGEGGPDSQLIQFLASPGERVSIMPQRGPNDRMYANPGGGPADPPLDLYAGTESSAPPAVPDELVSGWDELSTGGKWKGVGLGILDLMGSGNPADLYRTPQAYGEHMRDARADQDLRNFYKEGLGKLDKSRGELFYDQEESPADLKERERLLANLSDIDTPSFKTPSRYLESTRSLPDNRVQPTFFDPRLGEPADPFAWIDKGEPRSRYKDSELDAVSATRRHADDKQLLEQKQRHKLFYAMDDKARERVFAQLLGHGGAMLSSEKEAKMVDELRKLLVGKTQADPAWHDKISGEIFREMGAAVNPYLLNPQGNKLAPGIIDSVSKRHKRPGWQ